MAPQSQPQEELGGIGRTAPFLPPPLTLGDGRTAPLLHSPKALGDIGRTAPLLQPHKKLGEFGRTAPSSPPPVTFGRTAPLPQLQKELGGICRTALFPPPSITLGDDGRTAPLPLPPEASMETGRNAPSIPLPKVFGGVGRTAPLPLPPFTLGDGCTAPLSLLPEALMETGRDAPSISLLKVLGGVGRTAPLPPPSETPEQSGRIAPLLPLPKVLEGVGRTAPLPLLPQPGETNSRNAPLFPPTTMLDRVGCTKSLPKSPRNTAMVHEMGCPSDVNLAFTIPPVSPLTPGTMAQEAAIYEIPLPHSPRAISPIPQNMAVSPGGLPIQIPLDAQLEPLRKKFLDQAPFKLPLVLGPRLHPDRLGKLVERALVSVSTGLSFLELCVQHRGQPCLANPSSLDHPAAFLLGELRESGAPAILLPDSPSWTPKELDSAVRRGAHRSTLEFRDFLRDEFADMIEAGQWLALPYSVVRHLPNLRISPTGVVPQRDRRPRIIVDYSFYKVNQSMLSVAPDSMQFGHAFLRLLQLLNRADTRRGTIYISKTDIADAFMRVWIQVPSIPILGAILPSHPGEEPLVAFPMILPMGWTESPQYLCAVSETIADLANQHFQRGDGFPTDHRFDTLADTSPERIEDLPATQTFPVKPPKIRSTGPLQQPLNTVDVFMDDFIHITQLPLPDRLGAHRTLFECIDQVLRPLQPSDNCNRKEPNSVKKLIKGDAAWTTKKVILGWLINTEQRTIELPPHRIDRLNDILNGFTEQQHRTSRKKWQQLLGELRSMVLAIPGGRGLFSQLQSVLTYPTNAQPSDRLRLTPAVHDQLCDFRWLAKELASRPTRWGELVDNDPSFLGTVDASGLGMGGIWLHCNNGTAPLMWRCHFDPSLQNQLISSTNPTGTITNSDLEQTSLIMQQDIIAQQHDIRERTLCAMTDNMAALSRDQHGSTSVDAPSAYLCRLSAFHQRTYRYRLHSSYIPGPLNVMADALSRRWDLDDSQLLAFFNSHFPQTQPWLLCPLRPEMHLSAMLALSKKRCNLEYLKAAASPPPPTLKSGTASVNNTSWMPTLPRSKIQSSGFKSSLREFETAGFQPVATVSDLTQWRMPSTLLHRRSPSWVRPTPASNLAEMSFTRDWLDN
jgi:hypothetical protein